MAEIKCPMCGKPNPAELDVCQYCEARLKPVTDELARSQPPIHPGEEPTEQDTGQLEPILPQWLRDVRQQARDSAENDENAEQEQAPAEEEALQPEPEKPADLLAGLQSQSDEDDEIPDWLAGLRGEEGQAPVEESSTEEDDLAALKSMLGEDAPASQESEASALPGWISDLGAEGTDQSDADALSAFQFEDTTEEPAQAEPQQPAAPGSDFEWDADFGSESPSQAESAEDDTPFDTDLPAWLQGADATPRDEGDDVPLAGIGAEEPGPVSESEDVTPPAREGDLPDWLSSLGEEEVQPVPQQDSEQPEAQRATDWLSSLGEGTAQQEASDPTSEIEIPDWASSLGEASSEETPQTADEPAASDDIPDWAASTREETAGTVPEQEASDSTSEIEIPDWVSSLGESESEVDSLETSDELAGVSDLPDWATSTGEDSVETASQDELQPTGEGDLPDWLSSLGEEGTSQEGEELAPSAESMEISQPATEDEMPDWLSSLGDEGGSQEEDQLTFSTEPAESFPPAAEDDTPDWLSSLAGETVESEQPAESIESSAVMPDLPTEESDLSPALVDDEDQPLSAEDVDSILSMDMPDWMTGSEAMGEEDEAVAEGSLGDDLDPAELPSWVQAMRPVESVISETDGETVEDQPVEEQGPLAGLRGVLPAVPGVGPSSKPKAYSVKLQASAEQQANATMLEQMLAKEEFPKPASEQKVVGTQRLLRWVITVLLLLVVGGTIFGGTQFNRMPTSAPLETSAVLNYIQNALPMDAPVLLIFDYEAALAGELEPAAAPLVDHMLTLKHPRLSFVSSLPTGPGLAERFMSNIQGSHNYERDQQFVNLGYLPGGAAGVLAFSENPINTKPLTSTGRNAWETPALQGVDNLSDFAAIILLTNDIETARTWIEQTEMTRGEARLLVVSSAQSGPMIQPYYQSGQVDGMITGLDGSAPIEQVNSGRPGTVRRYWDAYGFGLLTAVALITLGSLWNLFSGWQARRKEQGEE